MLLHPDFLPDLLIWISNIVSVVIFFIAASFAPWRMIFDVPLRQHLLLGSLTMLVIFWLMHFQITERLILHPVLLSCVALMVGFRFSVLIGAFATLFYLLLKGVSLSGWGLHVILNVAIPAFFIVAVNYWVRRWNPANLFFYTLGIGFAGSALTIPLIVLMAGSIGWYFDLKLLGNQIHFELEWILLAMFPEAFINGALVSSITVFFPEWMKTFDEDYFLSR